MCIKWIRVGLVALLGAIILPLTACTENIPPKSNAPTAQQAATPAPAASPKTAKDAAPQEEDWRKVDVFSTGTITQDIGVLYLLEGSRLALYRDAPQKLPILTLDLSALESPLYSFENLSFADKNDDGYNDIVLPLQDAGSLTYLWDIDTNAFSKKPLAAEGLWLTIGSWPDQAVYFKGEENQEGVASHTWLIPDGAAFVLERLPPVEPGAEAVREVTADFEQLPPSSIEVKEDEAISQRLTYPAYRLRYHTEGDGGFFNEDVYVQTDGWDSRLHVVTPQEADQEYEQQMEAWVASLLFQETDMVISVDG